MSSARRTVSAIAWGVAPAAGALGAALWAMSPGGMAILVSSTILSLTWWLVVPFGVVIATTLSRKAWTGFAVGAGDVLLFHTLMVFSRPVAERLDAFVSPTYLLGALGTMALPWAIGMVLGWASIVRQPVRHDGAPGARV